MKPFYGEMVTLVILCSHDNKCNHTKTGVKCAVVQWLARWTANREFRDSNPGQGRNLDRDFSSSCAPSQLRYDKYTEYSEKMKWRRRELATRSHMPRLKNEVANTSYPWLP